MTQPFLFNGEPDAAGWILPATCACTACARGSVLKFAPWMFLLSMRLKNDSHSRQCRCSHCAFDKVKRGRGMRGFYSDITHAVKKQPARAHPSLLNSPSESHCWKSTTMCHFPSRSPDGFSRLLINRDFNSSRQDL